MNAPTTVTGIDDALAQLGVSDDVLTPEQYAELDENGYLAIPDVIDAQWLVELRERTTQLQQREGAPPGARPAARMQELRCLPTCSTRARCSSACCANRGCWPPYITCSAISE